MSTVLFVDDAATFREQFEYDLKRKGGYDVLTASHGREAIDMLYEHDVDVAIVDLEMPVMDGLQMIEEMREKKLTDVPVIIYTGTGNYQKCVDAVKLGAFNFFDKAEVKLDQLIQEIENALEFRRLSIENKILKKSLNLESPLIGESRAIEELRNQINKVSRVPSSVIIHGESGTGKELVARELHAKSERKDKPLVALNCAALPDNLVESELFGFEKGAFSGAIRTTKGKFEVADGGVLFLDEIGDMSLSVQAKLLRVLEENEVSRLGGGAKVIKIDTWVITATNRDLEKEIEEGNFRQDLYYRISTHRIHVPPLRDRLEDVPLLTAHFLKEICERIGFREKKLDKETLQILKSYDWRRNNVRELENIVERMVIQAEGDWILPAHVPAEIKRNEEKTGNNLSSRKSFKELKHDAEKQILLQYLKIHNWHITNTAKALGISNHANLLKMMRRLGISRPDES